jgi:hypothetical protein
MVSTIVSRSISTEKKKCREVGIGEMMPFVEAGPREKYFYIVLRP